MPTKTENKLIERFLNIRLSALAILCFGAALAAGAIYLLEKYSSKSSPEDLIERDAILEMLSAIHYGQTSDLDELSKNGIINPSIYPVVANKFKQNLFTVENLSPNLVKVSMSTDYAICSKRFIYDSFNISSCTKNSERTELIMKL